MNNMIGKGSSTIRPERKMNRSRENLFQDGQETGIKEFWKLMDEMHGRCGNDQKLTIRWLKERLMRLPSS